MLAKGPAGLVGRLIDKLLNLMDEAGVNHPTKSELAETFLKAGKCKGNDFSKFLKESSSKVTVGSELGSACYCTFLRKSKNVTA